MVEQNLTQLEEKLFEKIKNIEKFGITAKYLPKRVEPGVAYQLNQESRWSRYSGESLFINQQILVDENLQESIFWREAFLFFAPKEMREIWWVRLLANCFPFSIKQTNENYVNWEKIWGSVITSELQTVSEYRKIALSLGQKGLIEALRLCLHRTFSLRKINRERRNTSNIELNLKEFSLILSKIINESVGLNESSVDIMKIALIKQTTKPSELEKFSNKSKSSISKVIKKLIDMQVLYTRFQVNIHLLNLGNYYMILQCTKKQFDILRKNLPKHPYLFSSFAHYLSGCFIMLKFVGPRTKEFYQHLTNYGKQLEQINQIIEYNVFELFNPFRSYSFKYFNPKTKTQSININDIAVNFNLLRELPDSGKGIEDINLENIKIDMPQFSRKTDQLDTTDIEILNQIFHNNSTRRAIQKAVKKDMNDIVKRLQRFEEEQILTEDVYARLPDSYDVMLFIEEEKKSKKESVTLLDKMKLLSYHLPNVFFSEIKGTFKGVFQIVTLPEANVMQFTDFVKFFLPTTTNIITFVGIPIETTVIRKLPVDRWIDNKWVFYDSDFET